MGDLFNVIRRWSNADGEHSRVVYGPVGRLEAESYARNQERSQVLPWATYCVEQIERKSP